MHMPFMHVSFPSLQQLTLPQGVVSSSPAHLLAGFIQEIVMQSIVRGTAG